MERYLTKTSPTTSVTFHEDGVAVDPGTVTLTITREDGTVLASALTTTGTGAAARSYNLTGATHTVSLDVLRLDWLSATKGPLTTYAEIVGGFLCTLSELRATAPLTNVTLYPSADLAWGRTVAEAALEDACGVAFVPRYGRDKFDGPGTNDILLPPRLLSVESVTVGGTTVDVSTLELYRDGRLYNPAGWTEGRRNVVVKFTHGYRSPPPRVGRAARLLAKRFLVQTPVSDRAISMTNEDGAIQYMVTAGVRGAVFDVPEANAVIQEYGVAQGVG